MGRRRAGKRSDFLFYVRIKMSQVSCLKSQVNVGVAEE
jgi:hypothetical protein